MRVAVIGEALVDLAADPADPTRYTAYPGGSPANVAVTLGRLGMPVSFLGRLSADPLGRLLRAHLAASDVDLSLAVAAAEPASLALVSLDAAGGAVYTFHVAGTADWQWRPAELPAALGADTVAVHAGSIALAVPPGGPVIERWLAAQRADRTVSIDPNVRPALVGDRDRFRDRLAGWVAGCDLLKVSADDLAWVYPGVDPVELAHRWCAAAGGPALVVVTDGPRGATGIYGTRAVHRPAPPVAVVDTVGAGDAFAGGLLDHLGRAGLLGPGRLATIDAGQVAAALDFAGRVAAATVARAGADPPRRSELGAGSDQDGAGHGSGRGTSDSRRTEEVSP